ncbi:hypothetical protein [Paenibacillus sp. Soil787]|uniref:hypothetical protein n=1 Tax=Paenibacillus sp. Soil787 TaxID=1736411 RepID=UPI0006F2BA6E|nr:hypothetical protein [Paenibacillus sp. Soil787]KRF31667.1 hypothetical protein ASG93_04835 [Paenibacillus sp. Soil787]
MTNAANAKAGTNEVLEFGLSYSKEELQQLIQSLPGSHPLVTDLRKKLTKVYEDKKIEGCPQALPNLDRFTYLIEKVNVSGMTQLFSKALTLMNICVELEDMGYEIQAVRNKFFSREVKNIQLRG